MLLDEIDLSKFDEIDRIAIKNARRCCDLLKRFIREHQPNHYRAFSWPRKLAKKIHKKVQPLYCQYDAHVPFTLILETTPHVAENFQKDYVIFLQGYCQVNDPSKAITCRIVTNERYQPTALDIPDLDLVCTMRHELEHVNQSDELIKASISAQQAVLLYKTPLALIDYLISPCESPAYTQALRLRSRITGLSLKREMMRFLKSLKKSFQLEDRQLRTVCNIWMNTHEKEIKNG